MNLNPESSPTVRNNTFIILLVSSVFNFLPVDSVGIKCYSPSFYKSQKSVEFTDKDVTLTIEGLSTEYAQRFKDKKQFFVDYLNRLTSTGLPSDIKPINIKVIYKDDDGIVGLIYSYNPADYSNNAPLSKKNNRLGIKTGANMKLEYMLFDALGYYKLQVANNGNYSIDKRLAALKSGVKMSKSNGDFGRLFATNTLNDDASYPLFIYPTIYLTIGGKEYNIQASNAELLNEYHIFNVGPSTGLDGKVSKNYYFYKFYNLPIN